jgi:hypothetical protein
VTAQGVEDNCTVCSSIQKLRKSPIANKNRIDLMLPQLQDMMGQDKSISTSRSINESRLEKNRSCEDLRPKFGESAKKIA